MEVPEGVPSVSTQCPSLLRVLEPSQRGAPSRLSPCQPSSRKQLSRRLTVASAADSWLVDPRVGCNKAYITTLVCNRHLLIVDLPHVTRDTGQHYLEFHFTFVRVYYLTTVEGKEFLPGSSLGNLDFGSRFKDFAWLRIGALCLYYLSGTPTLRSFIYEDVGEPTSHPCS